MIDIKEVLQVYKEKRIKLESESQYRQIWIVDGHTVMIQIKKGRRILTCDCENHTRYCNSSALCRHKESVIAFPIIDIMQQQITKMSDTIKALGLTQDKKFVDSLLFEMNGLERLSWVRQLKSK